MGNLKELFLNGNPVTKMPKYRDEVILSTIYLVEIDGKTIKLQERQYLAQLYKRKQAASGKAQCAT